MANRIAIIGTGYVGLVTGTCLAELGHDVICIDNNEDKINDLRQGIIPIYEPGLDVLVRSNHNSGRLHFSTDLTFAVKNKDAIFICVGTPPHPETGEADLVYVKAAARQIAESITGSPVIVTKSTVPVGTNKVVGEILMKFSRLGVRPSIASNPEFLREGAAVSDFLNPDRIVVGSDDAKAEKTMRKIYAPLTSREVPFVATSLETAELIKYAANAFLAVKVTFINEMADLCEKIGADVEQIAHGMGLDNRIGKAFLRAGPGWGGSCFPKDTRALQSSALKYGVDMSVVSTAITSNDARKLNYADRIITAMGGNISGKKIAVLGLTFKGGTDDMRDSPALDILPVLTSKGAIIEAFDPSFPKSAHELLPSVRSVHSAMDAAFNADALVILTDWKEFKSYDLGELSSVMKTPILLDWRNLYSAEDALEAGFLDYRSTGRGGFAQPAPSKIALAV